MSLAITYNWTPDEVDALDPDFLDSLLACMEARDSKPTPIKEGQPI